MPNTSYVSQEDQTQVNLSTRGTTKIAEMISPFAQTLVRPKGKLDIKKVPNQTDDTPKTKRRYYYEKTQNYVSYARAKQLGLVK